MSPVEGFRYTGEAHPVHQIEMALYQGRADTERELAETAATIEAAAIHAWLARKYQRLADQCQADAAQPNVPLPFPSVR